MEKLTQFIQPYKKYLVEATLISLSAIVVIASAILYVVNVNASTKVRPAQTTEKPRLDLNLPKQDTIYVDVTGSVMKPDSYELPASTRLKDALDKAGGLSELADKDFFYRNFNLARLISDQEKIYVPSVIEVSTGIFKENYRLFDPVFISDQKTPTTSPVPENTDVSGKIHINSASVEELDTLPGVGTATVQKIVDGRPYSQLDELVSKKAVGSAVFEKFKELIDL